MEDKSDLILRLHPENAVSAAICRKKENYRRLCVIMGTPVLTFTFSCPPKDPKKGFLFGYNDEKCDVKFPRKKTSSNHFSITINSQSGLIILVNASKRGTIVGRRMLSTFDQSKILEPRAIIAFGDYRFSVDIPNRHTAHERFIANQSFYLGYMLSPSTPAAVFSKYTTPHYTMNRVGPYSEVSRLGKGGFGEVLVLCTRDTGNLYAAKRLFITTDDVKIRQEASILVQLSHRNIVKFKDMIEEQRSILLLMEYLPCGSLHSSLLRTPLSGLEVVEQCLEGLKYIHSKGVIHRDIKPENIVLQSTLPVHVKIIDFGLATVRRETGMCGTVPYCAPEMYLGYPHSETIDIWSLGITILEIGNFNVMQIADKYLYSNVLDYEKYFWAIKQLLPGTRSAFSTLVYRMLDEDPCTRYSAEMCLELMATVRVQHQRGRN